jgi:transposase-like protein
MRIIEDRIDHNSTIYTDVFRVYDALMIKHHFKLLHGDNEFVFMLTALRDPGLYLKCV